MLRDVLAACLHDPAALSPAGGLPALAGALSCGAAAATPHDEAPAPAAPYSAPVVDSSPPADTGGGGGSDGGGGGGSD